MTTLLEQAKALPVSDRVRLAQELWESLLESGYDPQLSAAQRTELDRRLQAHAKDPHDVVSWDTVKANLTKKYGKP